MPAKVIRHPLPGETLVGIDPELLSRLDVNWQHRLSLFTGRALTATALDLEQANHSGLLALTGQMVSPGVVHGLRAMLDLAGDEPFCHIHAGSGITVDGEDVTLATPMRTALSSIPVAVDGVVLEGKSFKDFTQDASNQSFAGVLVLQPVTIRMVAAQDGQEEATPITDSCQSDPDEYAFEDWQLVDGCRLVFHAWPKDLLTLPSTGADWRNQIAYTIYQREAALAGGDVFPWENVGLPIGLLGFDDKWKPIFIDRHAVVRTGGYPRRRASTPDPLDIRIDQGDFVAAYNPFLAEARIHQFAEELSETGPQLLADQFSFLPPVGVVPVSAVDLFARRNVSFPGNYQITARPAHTEELDSAIIASASLEPFNLNQSDEIEILVPVPDAVYDPKLLVVEEVSPEFQAEVDESTTKRDDDLRHRKDLQLKGNALLKPLGLRTINVDDDVSEEEKAARDGVYAAPADEVFGTTLDDDHTTLISEEIKTLKSTADSSPYTVTVEVQATDSSGKAVTTSKAVKLIAQKDWDDLNQYGLEHFIQTLQHKVDSANDLVDLAFLRSQTDIYRYRQHILSAADATRLATSPILAQIAQGTTANATKDDLQKFLEDARKSKPTPPSSPTPSYMQRAPNLMPIFSFGGLSRSIGARVFVPPPPPARPAPAAPAAKTAIRTAGTVRMVSPLVVRGRTPAPSIAAFQPAAPVHVAPAAPAVDSFASLPMYRFLGAAGGLIPAARPATAQPATGPTSTDVHQDSPLIGAQLNFRTVSIAQRLQQPPSQEALFFSTANRLEITDLLNDLEITVEDLPLLMDAEEQDQPSDPAKDPTIKTVTRTLGELKDSTTRPQIMNRMLTPHVKSDPDEAHVFSVGIRVLEQHTALLRAIEGRIQLYQNFIQFARCTLKNIQDTLTSLDARMKQVEDDLNSARHDLAFATALLAEETKRVQDVNDRRAQVIQKYVTYLVFRRAPAIESSIALPTRPLYPAMTSSAVPACMSRKIATPPELQDMLALLREAPVSWIPDMVALIDRFDRPYLLQRLAVTVRDRAMVRQSSAPASSFAQFQAGALAAAMSNMFTKHQAVMANYRAARAYFEPAVLEPETWLTQHGYLQSIASIGDLLDSDYASPVITRTAANLFQQIGGVAGCLYERMSAVEPIYRLRWAERLSDTAAHTDLHDLAVLPTWSDVDYMQRRELQSYVDWLFSRLEPSIQEAADYINDLVRVCILLASHAPVDEIIHGVVIHSSPLNLGNVVRISVASPRIFRGMQVLLYSGSEIAAHGTVSDLGSSEIAVSVVSVLKSGKTIGSKDHVQFVTSSIPLRGATHLLQ